MNKSPHRLPWLHAPVRHPIVGLPNDYTPSPPMPDVDPYRDKRKRPLSEDTLAHLRRMARGERS